MTSTTISHTFILEIYFRFCSVVPDQTAIRGCPTYTKTHQFFLNQVWGDKLSQAPPQKNYTLTVNLLQVHQTFFLQIRLFLLTTPSTGVAVSVLCPNFLPINPPKQYYLRYRLPSSDSYSFGPYSLHRRVNTFFNNNNNPIVLLFSHTQVLIAYHYLLPCLSCPIIQSKFHPTLLELKGKYLWSFLF